MSHIKFKNNSRNTPKTPFTRTIHNPRKCKGRLQPTLTKPPTTQDRSKQYFHHALSHHVRMVFCI